MALAKELQAFLDCFDQLEDPRFEPRCLHPLPEILLCTVCGIAASCDGWEEIEEFAIERLDFLRQYLPFEHGAPSDDTLRRFFRALDPQQFQTCFTQCFSQWCDPEAARSIAIDGKTLRGSRDGGKRALHLVSAFVSEARIVLAQKQVAEKSNEITAIPELLKLLDLNGATVSIDAMGCQHAIAHQIVDGKADFVLGLKGNQSALHDDVVTLFDHPPESVEFFRDEQVDKGHGRIETRRAITCGGLGWLHQRHPHWGCISSIVKIESERLIGDTHTSDVRYYVASFDPDAARANAAVRSHWAIENQLHWVLDMSFGEDQSRIRKGHAVANMAVVRHAVLNGLSKIQGKRESIKRLRKKASWSTDVLARVIDVLI